MREWSLVSGMAQSMITRWGLLQHWWVVFKLAIRGRAMSRHTDDGNRGAAPSNSDGALHSPGQAVIWVAAVCE